MASAEAPKFCASCGAAAHSQARFCAQCGKSLIPQNFSSAVSFQACLYTVALALPLWGAITLFSSSLSGAAPDRTLTASSKQIAKGDPEVDKLRELLQQQPDSVSVNMALANALYARLDESPSSMQLAFEIIDLLAKVLKIEGQNKEAILLMADVSFAQQAFSKASEFYQRYLSLDPKNPDVRAKFASSLTFTGEFDKAVEELQDVIKEHPKNFHANAYLAIAYAQVGKLEQAKQVGKTSLALAPSDQAKERFQRFLDTLEQPQGQEKAQTAPAETNNAEQAIFQSVKANAVAGPKLNSSKQPSADKIVLYFENFPMEAMPPFAKDKFLARIREAAAPFTQITEVLLVDKTSGKDMERVIVKR